LQKILYSQSLTLSTSTALVVLYGWNVPWFCYKEIFRPMNCKSPVELGHLTRFSLVSLRNYVDVIFTHCKATITSSSSSSLCLHVLLALTCIHIALPVFLNDREKCYWTILTKHMFTQLNKSSPFWKVYPTWLWYFLLIEMEFHNWKVKIFSHSTLHLAWIHTTYYVLTVISPSILWSGIKCWSKRCPHICWWGACLGRCSW